jgi:hypothetical protein
MLPTYEAVVDLTAAFCAEHLNVEYRDLARRMTAALCRKRPSPVAAGYSRNRAGTATMPSHERPVAPTHVEAGLVPRRIQHVSRRD